MMLTKPDLFDGWFDLLPNLFDRRELTYLPAFDISEDAETVTLEADVPGMTDKEIRVTLEEGVLTVAGEKRPEEEKAGRNYRRIERRFGSFRRSFSVPEAIDLDAIRARCKEGVLTITLPRTAAARPRTIEVKVE